MIPTRSLRSLLFWDTAPYGPTVVAVAVVQSVAGTVEVEALSVVATTILLGTPVVAVGTNIVHARSAVATVAGSRQK